MSKAADKQRDSRRPVSAEAQLQLLAGRRARNWALFGCLAFFAALIYAVTIVKIKLGYGP